jgi:hypothetical protein
MKVITTSLGFVGLLTITYLGILFANFSRRLGAVTKMRDHYRWFQIGSGFVALAAVSQIMRGIATLAPQEAPSLLLMPWFALASFHVPLAIGVTLDLAFVWYYWGWILKEKIE